MTPETALVVALIYVIGSYLITINLALVPSRMRPGFIWLGIVALISFALGFMLPGETPSQVIQDVVPQAVVFFVFRGIRAVFVGVRDKRRAGATFGQILSDAMATAFGLAFGIAMLLFGLFQFAAGWAGIEDRFGWGWGLAAVIAGFAQFSLPLTVGTYLCAHNIWHWSVLGSVLFALPGLVFMIPHLIFGIVSALWGRMRPAVS